MNNYPIVLAHGIARFDALWNPLARFLHRHVARLDSFTDRFNYFRNIRSHLTSHGFEVYHADVAFSGTVEKRAGELRAQILDIPAERVHIIAHSMGGLDARHMIVDMEMGNRVASLSTIGTPHLGTSFADWGVVHHGDVAIKWLHNYLDLDGFLNLTRESCARFNEHARASEVSNSVAYRTYAAAQSRPQVFRPLQLSWDIIKPTEGDNDGLVSLSSQRWTPLLTDGHITKQVEQYDFPFPADHLNECGWWDSHEDEKREQYELHVKEFYLEIARRACAAT